MEQRIEGIVQKIVVPSRGLSPDKIITFMSPLSRQDGVSEGYLMML